MPRSRSFTSNLYRGALAISFMGSVLLGLLSSVTTANADVLVNSPAPSVCAGSTFQVGVWYQSYSGGPHAYWLEVFGPTGQLLLNRFGDATTTWTFWAVRTTKVGVYRSVYVTPSGVQGFEYTGRTTAHAC